MEGRRSYNDTEKKSMWQWNDEATSHRTPRIAGNRQTLGERHGTDSFSQDSEVKLGDIFLVSRIVREQVHAALSYLVYSNRL